MELEAGETTNRSRTTAPGRLGIVHEFMKTGGLSMAGEVRPEMADEVRRRYRQGESQPTLAAEFGLSQRYTSALLRGNQVEDELRSAASATAWLRARELCGANKTIDGEGLARLLELRGVLRAMAAANNHDEGEKVGPAPVERLNRIAAAVPFALRFAATSEAELLPAADGVDGTIAQLLGIVFDAMREGSWQRLKACAASDCVGVFYDWSRNRTGTWCAMAVCGNRTKARAFQERKRGL